MGGLGPLEGRGDGPCEVGGGACLDVGLLLCVVGGGAIHNGGGVVGEGVIVVELGGGKGACDVALGEGGLGGCVLPLLHVGGGGGGEGLQAWCGVCGMVHELVAIAWMTQG